MTVGYRCQSSNRRTTIREAGALNGIDYIEVASADQKTLDVYFIHNLPGETDGVPAAPPLTAANVSIEGARRVSGINVGSVGSSDNILKVQVDQAGDYSTYTLKLVTSSTNSALPTGFDPQLSEIDFSFKAECPSDFDCVTTEVCPPSEVDEPDIDYRAKDYATFRRLILDRMSTLMPAWRASSPADLEIALVEMLAYVGDHLSYFQDAVGTEAYLGTARTEGVGAAPCTAARLHTSRRR